MVITSTHGRTIYSDDKLSCVCIEFDYWGNKKTLQVPYAAYRPWLSTEINLDMERDDLVSVGDKPLWVAKENIDTFVAVPKITDKKLQKVLEDFKNDRTGEENTNCIIKYGSPAGIYCRSIELHGRKNYFDVGNVYEMSIVWIEADNIDKVDPTLNMFSHRALGTGNCYGRFRGRNNDIVGCWTSSEFNQYLAWVIFPNGFIGYTSHESELTHVIPTKVV